MRISVLVIRMPITAVGSANYEKYRRISEKLLAVSGNANNGFNAGAFCVNANYSSGNTNANYGSQLSYLLFMLLFQNPCLLAKHQAIPFGVSNIIYENSGEQ